MNIHVIKEKIIPLPAGNVRKGIQIGSVGFEGIEEIYFSELHKGVIKGWKKHKEMKMNLMCIHGMVKFVFYNENNMEFSEYIVSSENNIRLSVEPGYYFAFQNMVDYTSVIGNFASMKHDDAEVVREDLSFINYNWS